jgi:hypothetical protein
MRFIIIRAISIAIFFSLIFSKPSLCEIINGPTRIHSAPNGSVIFTIQDGQMVDVVEKKGDWQKISWVVELPLAAVDGDKIKPNQSLFDFGGHKYGMTVLSVQIQKPKKTQKGTLQGEVSGFARTDNIKRIKLIIAPGITPKLGSHLIPKFVDRSKKTYSIGKAWNAPPFPADLKLEKENEWLVFQIGDLQGGGLGFKLLKDGTVSDWFCIKEKCVSEVKIGTDKVTIKLGGKSYDFINVEGFKSTDKPEDFNEP